MSFLWGKSSKKPLNGYDFEAGLGMGYNFDVTVDTLEQLFDDRGDFDLNKDLGGPIGIAEKLHVSLETGISKEEKHVAYADRVAAFGTNVFPSRKYANIFQLLWKGLQDVTLIILMIAAVISIGLGVGFPNEAEDQTRETGWIEGASILAAVIIVCGVTAGNDWSKDRQFRQLESEKDNDLVMVIRGGEVSQIRVFDLVVGDIVTLETGDRIPADGLYISGKEVRVDQSPLTGESKTVAKSEEEDPFLLSGSTISDGDAHMIVLAIGIHSQWGKILAELDPDDENTPLQDQLDSLAAKIGWGGLACAVVIFIGLTIWWVVDIFIKSDDDFEWEDLEDFIEFFIVSVTIVVVAVPEGLPLAVTISLAYSMKKMMKDNNLVRHLKACETMGGVTNICTDKTGTLTLNRMEVIQGWVAGSDFEGIPEVSAVVEKILCGGIAINSKAFVKESSGSRPREYLGNKTECALLVLASKMGNDWLSIRKNHSVVKQYNFSSDRKRMSTVVPMEENGKRFFRLFCKGAPEKLFKRSSYTLTESGEKEELTEEQKTDLTDNIISPMANDALRTLVLCYRDLDEDTDFDQLSYKVVEREMTLISIIGIQDPLRPDVKDAVRTCQRAGICVRMVTGDNIQTAKRIAQQCGILKKGDLAMEGRQFRALDNKEAAKALVKLRVLARSTPKDKQILVNHLKDLDEVVAVTGDGTNDAPALSDAHVGLAMGIEGTGVAKQASDIVILDDNFASIVKSVMWGRNVRENIQKFLQFQLTVNFVALVIAFVAAISGQGMPLKAIQLLWVNLIMDTMAALALGTEMPTPNLLNRPPVGKNYPLITSVMWRNILAQGLYQLALLFAILYAGTEVFGEDSESQSSEDEATGFTVNDTFLFNTFVFCQVFNEINARKVGKNEHNVFAGLHTNLIFVAVIGITVGAQFLIVEFGGKVMKTRSLDWEHWVASVALGAGSLVWGAIVRVLPAPEILCAKVRHTSSLHFDGLEDDLDETSKLVD